MKILVIISLLFNHNKIYANTVKEQKTQISVSLQNNVEKIRKIKDIQKVYLIMQYQEDYQRDVPITGINVFSTIGFLIFSLIILDKIKKPFVLWEKVIRAIFIFFIVYHITKLVGATVDIVRKRALYDTYTSHKTALPPRELKDLEKELEWAVKTFNPNAITDRRLREILLEFTDTKKLEKRNYYNLDPVRWIVSTKMSDQTIKRFSSLENKSNTEIINIIINNHKRDYKDCFINIRWMEIVLIAVNGVLILSTKIFKGKQNMLLFEELKKKYSGHLMLIEELIKMHLILFFIWALQWIGPWCKIENNYLFLHMTRKIEKSDLEILRENAQGRLIKIFEY